jgi:hypothetical protein
MSNASDFFIEDGILKNGILSRSAWIVATYRVLSISAALSCRSLWILARAADIAVISALI